jgi:hypothetical protein
MHPDRKNTSENNAREPNVLPATEVVQNPDPPNENARTRTDEPTTQNNKLEKEVGSEITDGEDG